VVAEAGATAIKAALSKVNKVDEVFDTEYLSLGSVEWRPGAPSHLMNISEDRYSEQKFRQALTPYRLR
jgi:hypothetical protein